jgi:endonuclease/exonuclease/phosphatase (EEP) superfamily protein YafD
LTDENAAGAAEKPAPARPLDPPKRKKHRGRAACMFGMAAGVGGLVAGQLAALRIEFDVFNQFTLQFALLAAAFLLGSFMPRARVLAAIVLFLGGLLAISAWPQIKAQSPEIVGTVAGGERAVKLMSFNTWFYNDEVDAIGAEIERQAPDIVMMVEFGSNKKPLFERFRQAFPYQHNCLDKEFCNLAVLSKFPIIAAETHVDWAGPPVIRVAFGPELGGLNLVGVHTIRFPYQRSHLKQIVELAKLLERMPGRMVVAGDFNATPFSRVLQSFEAYTGLNRITSIPTWPARLSLPQIGIDQIFVGDGIRVLEAPRIGANAGSDHYPVIATIAVPLN